MKSQYSNLGRLCAICGQVLREVKGHIQNGFTVSALIRGLKTIDRIYRTIQHNNKSDIVLAIFVQLYKMYICNLITK